MKGDKSAMKTDKKKKTTKKRKVVEEPIKPKRPDRPASALCAFVKEFSEREENIYKRTIYKECMKEWNEMTEKVKGQYISKAKRRMAAYEKKLQIYKREIEAVDKEDGNGREEAVDKEDGNGREMIEIKCVIMYGNRKLMTRKMEMDGRRIEIMMEKFGVIVCLKGDQVFGMKLN